MLAKNGIIGQGYFEVLPQAPSLVTPSKAFAGEGLPMDVDEDGVIIVADDDDDVDVDPMLDNLDLQGDDSGNAGALTDVDPIVDSTDGRLVPNGDLQGGDSGNAVAATAAAVVVNFLADGNLLSVGTTQGVGVPGGLKGHNNLTVNGGQSTNNVNDTSRSLHVPVLTGDCRDARNHVNKDDMSTAGGSSGSTPDIISTAEKLAASNAAANTTKTKSFKILNSSLMPTIWSQHQRTVRSTSAASVKNVILRAARPFPTIQDIDKALLAIPSVWSQFSPTLAYSPTTPS